MGIPLRWRHVIVNTKNTWLHGDGRGFRSREHRIHSSGDYKNPPPPEEHEGLRRYHQQQAGEPISIPQELRPAVVEAFQNRLIKEGYTVLVIACSANHLHALPELPDDRRLINEIVGRCKRAACEAMKHQLPGSIWAAKGEYKPIKDRSHQANTYHYIRDDQGPGTFVWTYKGEAFWIR